MPPGFPAGWIAVIGPLLPTPEFDLCSLYANASGVEALS